MVRVDEGRQESKQVDLESELRFRKVFEHCPDAIFLADGESGTIIDVNRAACELMDMAREGILGLHQYQLHPHEEAERYRAIFQEHVQTGQAITQDIYVQRPSGELVPVEISARVLEISGRPIIQGVFRDITERKQSEEALRESEEKYRDLVENISDVIYAVDENGLVTYVSPAIESFTGYTPSEPTGRPFTDFLHEDDLQRIRKSFARILSGHPTEATECRIWTKSGEIRCVRASSRPIFAEDHVVGVQGVLSDITDRKRAQDALGREKEQFRILAEESPLGVSIIAADGHYSYVNPKFVETFGYTIEDIPAGREWFDIAYPDEQYRHEAISTWITDLKESKRGEIRPRTFTVTCKDGSQKAIHFIAVTMESGDQFVIYEDITERRLAEEAYRAVVEHSLQGLVIVQDFRIVFANLAFADMSGHTVEELLSLAPAEVKALVHPEDQEVTWGRFRDRIDGRPVPPRFEYRGIRKDGAEVWVEVFANPITYRGRPAVQAALVDISERKRAEQALVESEEKYRSLVERANDGIGILQEGSIKYVNQRMAELAGYPIEELIGSRFVELIHPDEIPRLTDRYERRMAGDKVPPVYETVINLKDGSHIDVEINASVITYEGKPADFAILRDITERKRAEEEIIRRSQELAALNEIGRAIGSTLNLTRLLKLVAQKTAQICNVERCSILLLDKEKKELVPMMSQFASGAAEAELWRIFKEETYAEKVDDVPVVREVIRERRTVVLDASSRSRLPPRWIEPFGIESVVLVPLTRRDETIGLMALDYTTEGQPFSAEQVNLATTIGSQVAIAMENARLHEETKQRVEELSAIEEIVQELSSTLDLHTVIQLVLDKAIEATAASAGLIGVLDEQRTGVLLLAQQGYPAELSIYQDQPWSINQGIIGRVVGTGELSLVDDVSQDPDYAEAIPETRSQLTVPIIREDAVAGAIALESPLLRGFSKQQAEFVHHLAGHAAVAMANARLYEEAMRRASELEALRKTALDITKQLDVPQLLRSTVEQAAALVGTKGGGLYLYHPEEEELELVVSYYLDRDYTGTRLKVGEALSGRVVQTGEPLIVEDYENWEGRSQKYEEAHFRGVMAVPLRWGEKILGVINVTDVDQPRTFTAHDQRLLELFANQAAIAIENARLYEQAQARSAYLETLQRINATLRSTLPLSQVLQTIAQGTAEAFGYVGSYIALPDEGMKRLIRAAVSGSTLIDGVSKLTGFTMESFSLPLEAEENPIVQAFVTGELQVWSGTPERIVVGVEPRVSPKLARPLQRTIGVKLAACVPLLVAEKTVGVLGVLSPREQLTDDERAMILGLANQAGLAIENARLHGETQRRVEELSAIEEIVHELSSTLDFQKVIELVLNKAIEATHASAGGLSVLNEERTGLLLLAHRGYPEHVETYRHQPWSIDRGIFGRVARTGELSLLDDVGEDPDYAELVPETQSQLTVPIIREGKVIGAIVLESPQLGGFSREQAAFIQHLAKHAAVAMENARLYQEQERRSQELMALHETSLHVTSRLNLDDLLRAIIVRAVNLLNGRSGDIYLHRSAQNELVSAASHNLPAQLEGMVMTGDDGLAGKILRTGQPLIVDDYDAWEGRSETYTGYKFGRVVGVPIEYGEEFLGVLVVERELERPCFTEKDMDLLSLFAHQAAIAIENAHLFVERDTRIKQLATLHEISLEVVATTDLSEVLTTVVEQATTLLDAQAGAIDLFDPDAQKHQMVVTHGYRKDLTGVRLSPGQGVVGKVAETKQPLIVDDYAHWPERVPQIEEDEIGPALGVPLMRGDEFLGVLTIDRRPSISPFDQNDLQLATLFANQAAIAIENARLYDRLKQSEERYRAYVENVPAAIWEADAEGRFTYWSPQIENVIGYAPGELLGRTFHESLAHPDERDSVRTKIQDRVAEKGEDCTLTHRALHRDGSILHLETSVRPVRDDGGQVVKHQGVVRDVSERIHLQAQLVQSAKLSAIGQMISGVAHELNNPLTTVMGYAQLLQASDVDETVKEDLQKIYADALRAQRIVQSLLTFARQKKPQRTPVDINDIIERTLSLRNYQLKVDNVEVVPELADNLPWTMADDYQLQQVFLNIINNAHQAMAEESRGGVLTVRSELMEDDIIRVSFTDTGPGIPPEILDRIFDPFFTTKDVGGGTGLGLSVSHGILQEHGGRIWAESEPGHGATFFVELPVRSWVEGITLPSPGEEPEPIPSESQRILVIDDERSIVNLIVRVLTESRYRVDGVTSAKLALERLHHERYDLIISDVKMPGMDGPACEKEVRAMDPELAERLIFMTGDLLSPGTQAFLESWKGTCIKKPFGVEELRAVVLEALS